MPDKRKNQVDSAPQDDEAARAARAKRLQDEIDQVISSQDKPDDASGGERSNASPGDERALTPESPRDFIERRMHELDAAPGAAPEEGTRDLESPPPFESPRDFIHRRMHELDKGSEPDI